VDEAGNEGLGEAALNPFATDVTTGALDRLIREIVPELAAGRLPVWPELAAEGEPAEPRWLRSTARSPPFGRLQAGRLPRRRHHLRGAAASAGAETIRSVRSSHSEAPRRGGRAAQAVELGFDTLKLRAGFERTTDSWSSGFERCAQRWAGAAPARRRRRRLGPRDRRRENRRIEPSRIEYVEQPLAAWDIAGHAALRERVEVPIALDESIDSEARRGPPWRGAGDVLVVKPARVGGLAATMRIVEAASAAGALVVLGTYFETGVGMAAVLRIAAAMGPVAHSRGRSPPSRRTAWPRRACSSTTYWPCLFRS